MSDKNKVLIRCAWEGVSAFDDEYGSKWGNLGACPAPPPCTDEATDFTCKKSKCKKRYSDEEKKQCKKTCDQCDALPPSASPPSAPEDKCGGRTDTNKCKIKNCEKVKGKCKKQCKKCKKQCKKKKLKKKCEKTCCDLS